MTLVNSSDYPTERLPKYVTLETELTASKSLIADYEKTLTGLVEVQLKGVPKPYLDLLEKMSLLDQLAWLSSHEDEVKAPKQIVRPVPQSKDKDTQPVDPMVAKRKGGNYKV